MVEEILDISRKARHRARSNEAENFHAAIVADPEAPGTTSDIDSALLTANGVDSAVAAEPNHQLVVTSRGGMVDILRSEEIISNIRASVLVADGPGCGCRDGRNLGDEFLREIARRVRVAFDVVVAAVPFPCRGPFDGSARYAVESRALRSGCGAPPAPEVILDSVAA